MDDTMLAWVTEWLDPLGVEAVRRYLDGDHAVSVTVSDHDPDTVARSAFERGDAAAALELAVVAMRVASGLAWWRIGSRYVLAHSAVSRDQRSGTWGTAARRWFRQVLDVSDADASAPSGSWDTLVVVATRWGVDGDLDGSVLGPGAPAHFDDVVQVGRRDGQPIYRVARSRDVRAESAATVTPVLDGRFTDAVAYGARAHHDQVRKGTNTPYLAHLLAVATLVVEHGGSEVQATAAVLHDVVEDQGGKARLADLVLRFGPEVAQVVEDLSDAVPGPDGDKAPWRERKESYLVHLHDLVDARSAAVLVSACDKLHNAESIVADASDPDGRPGLDVFDIFTGKADGTAWYYRSILDVLSAAELPPRLLVRLDRAVRELESAALAAMSS